MFRNTVQEILTIAAQRLRQAGSDTPALDAELLLARVLKKDRAWLYTYPRHRLTGRQMAGFYRLLRRRERREPIAYILGYKEFFALRFRVNRHVLIPRPETELLVETAISLAAQLPHTGISIADVGTGSGCIAIALAKHLPQARIIAIDTSSRALLVARYNAAFHHVDDRIAFLHGDLLEPLAGQVDVIVSNPPYIRRAELHYGALSPEVTQYEPRRALDGGPDGLALIRELLAQARTGLKPGGFILVEIGADQGRVAARLARSLFPAAVVKVEKDLAGLDRLLVIGTV